MSSSRIRATRLRDVAVPEPITDPEVLEAYLEDASGSPPGRAAGLLRPRHESEIATFLRGTLGKGITILPQAARLAIAPTVGFLVQVIKGTALASVIGFVELTKAGGMIANASFKPFLVFGCVALFYFALCFPVSLAAQHLERKQHGRAA